MKSQKEIEKRDENISEKIIPGNFLILGNETDVQIPERRVPNKMKAKLSMPRDYN